MKNLLIVGLICLSSFVNGFEIEDKVYDDKSEIIKILTVGAENLKDPNCFIKGVANTGMHKQALNSGCEIEFITMNFDRYNKRISSYTSYLCGDSDLVRQLTCGLK